ncbi:MAG: type II toxin-antitoxin system VapC family toxin [Candidatus Altiarchaeota archaeon]|nr:type II toxin-antitoxin system VapC family toxin [Candidatus Altiarchaeota archaeon]
MSGEPDVVFVDSNVIIKHIAGDERARGFMLEIEGNEFVGCVNQIVVSEVLFIYIKLKTGLRPLDLKRKPDLLRSLKLDDVFRIFELFQELEGGALIRTLTEGVMEEYGLLPNDALIAATCRFYGIKKIASFDEDFRRVDFLKVLRP